jgi:putative MATE family efflux protein
MLYAIVAVMGLGIFDSYFISFLGTEQLAAIALIVPITAMVTSFGLGLGMAISSLNSKLIGADDMSTAARLITDGFYLTGLVATLTILGLWWQLENIFYAVGADTTTMPFIKSYMHVWIFSVPATMYTMVTASTFRSLGDTRTSALIAISMTLTNLVFDPLLIFGIGPFPELGMAGAALATFIATLVAFSIGFFQLGWREQLLLWALPTAREFKKHIRQLTEIAIPAVLANGIVPLTSAVLIRLVAEFGNDAVAGYGVGSRIEAASLIIVYALSSTLPMFIGQNLGAGKKQRVYDAIRVAFKFVFLLQLGVYLLLAVFAQHIAALFSDQANVQQTIVLFLWIVPLSYGLGGIVILINVAMNVLGRPRLALYINILRLTLFYFPLAWAGAKLFGLNGLFIGIAFGNALAFLLAHFFLKGTLTALNIPKETKVEY